MPAGAPYGSNGFAALRSRLVWALVATVNPLAVGAALDGAARDRSVGLGRPSPNAFNLHVACLRSTSSQNSSTETSDLDLASEIPHSLPMKSTIQSDPVLRFFKAEVVGSLGNHLREVLLFGSRARGDATAESDYDLLVVVDKVDAAVVRGIDDIAGRALLDYGAVVSAFPIAEEERARRKYSPLLINVARESVAV